MKERPILFSAPMVRALLAGTKTQTRRVVTSQPARNRPHDGGTVWVQKDGLLVPVGTVGHLTVREKQGLRCPYGAPGDRLWVKEKTIKVEDRGWVGPVYAESDAGAQAFEWGYGESDDPDHIPPHAIKCRPSLFMTRAMSRITLEITGVRVERLQDISEADCRAEGALGGHGSIPGYAYAATPPEHYRHVWKSINGPGSWDANPWVWCVEFRRVTP